MCSAIPVRTRSHQSGNQLNMKTSRQNHLKVPIITFLVCVIEVNGASLIITHDPQYPNVSTSASLTCHIPSFTSGAEWLVNGLSLTLCQSSGCFPPSSTRYQYSANATAMTVNIASADIALDNTTWKCSHNAGIDIGYSSLTVYKLPSTLDINGINSSTLYEGDKVTLSVRTGCIHPSGSAYYAVIWKYVEATSAAENNFGTNINQTITSVGGCQNTYEDNLMFNLLLTNDMNPGNTTISISHMKMTFTMAGIHFYATKSVAYNVTSDGTAAPTPAPTTPKPGTKCQLELGLALGLGLGIQYVITSIDAGIIIYTSCKYAYILGLVFGLGLGVIFHVGWIIIVSLISKGNECKLELGLGLGLGSGMPYVISFIVSVIFMFFVCFLCKGIPNRVELGKGILTGFLLASVVGIILVYFKYDKLKPEQTSIPKRVEIGKGILTGLLFASVIGIVVVVYLMCHKRKRKLTSTKHEDNPPKQDGTNDEQLSLKPADTKGKTKNPGPTAVHTRTENKVEPNTNSKQTNHRQQPVPPANTGFEDTPTFRRLPQTPQNGEIKDRSLRGISATIDDKPDLASETPRPNKLPPIPLKQETVQEENTSEKHKKKRTKKKKKDQMNVETPEEENGETDLRDN